MNKQPNKIALFTVTPRSLTALLIAAVTRCPFTHAAICINGTWWHASETTGGFSKLNITDYADRHCTMFTFNGDLTQWVQGMNGKAYDWKGIAGWAKRALGMTYKANSNKFYCFEAALAGLLTARLEAMDKYPSRRGQLDTAISELMETAINCADLSPLEQILIAGKHNDKTGNGIITDKAIDVITRQPITGCDIAELFTSSRTGRFGALL